MTCASTRIHTQTNEDDARCFFSFFLSLSLSLCVCVLKTEEGRMRVGACAAISVVECAYKHNTVRG